MAEEAEALAYAQAEAEHYAQHAAELEATLTLEGNTDDKPEGHDELGAGDEEAAMRQEELQQLKEAAQEAAERVLELQRLVEGPAMPPV
jgi:hypothetical protein